MKQKMPGLKVAAWVMLAFIASSIALPGGIMARHVTWEDIVEGLLAHRS